VVPTFAYLKPFVPAEILGALGVQITKDLEVGRFEHFTSLRAEDFACCPEPSAHDGSEGSRTPSDEATLEPGSPMPSTPLNG
jgi:hypothetical protein